MNLKRIAAGVLAGAVLSGFSGVYPYAVTNYAIAAETEDEAETTEKEEALTAESFLAGGYDAVRATVYSKGAEGDSFNMNGRSYNQGVVFAGQYSYDTSTASICYNTKEINTLSWVWGHLDNASMTGATVSIYLDDVLMDKYTLSANMLQQEYIVDVSEASILKISVAFDRNAKFALADVTVDDIKPATSPKVPEYNSVDSFITSRYNYSNYSTFSAVSDLEAKRINGRYYYNGFTFSGSQYEATTNASASFNTENINNFSCSFGHVDNTAMNNATVYVYQDNILTDKLNLTSSMPISDYSVDVSETSELRIVIEITRNASYAMVDIAIDEFTTTKIGKAPTYKTTEQFLNDGYNKKTITSFSVASNLEAQRINGRYYYQGLIFGGDMYVADSYVNFNVENINSITATFGHIDNSPRINSVLQVYKDDVLTDKIDFSWNMLAKEITFDVKDCKNLRLYMYNDDATKYAMTDVVIDDIKPKKTFVSPDYENSKEFSLSAFDVVKTTYFDYKSDLEAFVVNGEKCHTGFLFAGEYYTMDTNSAISFNTDNVNTVSWTWGNIDGTSNKNATAKIYLDNVLEEEITLEAGMTPMNQIIDVSESSKLYIVVTNSGDGQYVLKDIEISDEIIKTPMGDVDNDSTVSSADASLVLAEYAALSTSGESILNAKQKKAADVNGDETIDASDASLILAYYAYVSTGGTETDMEKWLALDK